MKFLIQNYLILFMTSVLEIQSEPDGLSYATVYGIITMSLISIFIFIVLTIAVCRFKKITKESQFAFFTDGMNGKSRCMCILYYLNFFFMRLLICLLIGLTPSGSSIGLWVVQCVFQGIGLIVNLFKIYPDCGNRMTNFMTEVSTLMAYIYCFAIQFRNE
jgi:hypothetical protein